MKFFAVIDTNVLVSAMLKWDSVPGNILQLTISGIVTPVLNDEIPKEYREVLRRKKFHFSDEIIDAVLNGIMSQAVFVREENLGISLPDPKDIVFYEVTMDERKIEDAFLVTGNIKHFPTKPYVVTPRQFMEIILEKLT